MLFLQMGYQLLLFVFSQLWCCSTSTYISHIPSSFCKLDVDIFKTFRYVNIYLNGKWPTISTSALHKGNILICYSQEILQWNFCFQTLLPSSHNEMTYCWSSLTSPDICRSFVIGKEDSFITSVNNERDKT